MNSQDENLRKGQVAFEIEHMDCSFSNAFHCEKCHNGRGWKVWGNVTILGDVRGKKCVRGRWSV